MSDLVSIVVPAYNAERTLKESINSLLVQTYSNIEIIIIDDGSKDGTLNLAKAFEKKDNRVRVISISNGGVSNARNVGIQAAKGKFVAFMDSDDCMTESMIEILVSEMKADIDIVCCGYNVMNENKELLFEKLPAEMVCEKKELYHAIENMQMVNCMNTLWNKLFRKAIIDEAKLLMDTTISMGEDFLFVLEYFRCMKQKLCVVSQALYGYMLSSNGLQANFRNGLKLRINQTMKLKDLYITENYPLDGFYLEELRTIYILLLESKDDSAIIRSIFETEIYKEVMQQRIKCGIKFRLFYLVIRTKSVPLITISVKLFRLLKALSGRAYKW